MSYCINCGKELPENAKFCLNCGTPIHTQEKTVITQAKTTESQNDIVEQTTEELFVDPKAIENKKIAYGKELVEKYAHGSKIFAFPVLHPNLYNTIRLIILFAASIFFGLISFFTSVADGKFESTDPIKCFLVVAIWLVFSLTTQQTFTYLFDVLGTLHAASWAKNNKCDSDYAYSCVWLYREKTFMTVPSTQVNRIIVEWSLLHRGLLFIKNGKAKTQLSIYAVVNTLCSVLSTVACIVGTFCVVPIFIEFAVEKNFSVFAPEFVVWELCVLIEIISIIVIVQSAKTFGVKTTAIAEETAKALHDIVEE